ncbi:DUF1236 domain-containing protein [Aminobacter sp. BE322]|uniref:DUF1236 domain-containing protein n=1 Tax=unclassified Aminobacter TaxID=2644704 RepID=UPI003D24B06B
MGDVDVVIIGAGSAGLSAAKVLRNAGLNFRLLEAMDRIGGARLSGEQVVLSQRPADSGVVMVERPKGGGDTGAIVGGVTGAIAGAVIGGPVGAAVGGGAGVIAGGATGTAIDPPGEVRTYVAGRPLEPVYLDGEVVVGASLPETVQLAAIPDYQYRYVYVNNQPVPVDPSTRRIVYVMR